MKDTYHSHHHRYPVFFQRYQVPFTCSLCLWEHEATQRLYLFLCLLLAASVLLPAAQLFTITGIYLGLKFFVLDFIFFRYPRIRLKYDTTSRLWDTLPTDADLERRGEKVGSAEERRGCVV